MTTIATSLPHVGAEGRAGFPLAAVVQWSFFAVMWLALCRFLSSEWSLNEQYNYGWFVPFFAAYLGWLRLEDWKNSGMRTADDEVRNGSGAGKAQLAIAIPLLLMLLPLRLFEIGNPDWRPLGWLHAFVVIGITFLWIGNFGGPLALRQFAFPLGFILVAVPWVSPIETPVVQGLMRGIAAAAAETLTLCGVPAHLEGNLIRVSSGLVGVNEACSGVRSLQTSLMIGLLFGELKRLSIGRRLLLVFGAAATAVFANFLRAFWLVWVAATENTRAVDRWHDLAGYAIVGAVFAGSMLLAWLLSRGSVGVHEERPPRGTNDFAPRAWPTSALFVALIWLVAVEVGCEIWYRIHERDLIPQTPWVIDWPERAPGFHDIKIDESVARTLRYDQGREASWRLAESGSDHGENPATCMAFYFRWNAGGSSVVRARAHRPDICLPSAGWELTADNGEREFRTGAGSSARFRQVTFRAPRGQMTAHTFFCLQEDQRHPDEARPDLALASGLQPDWSLAGRWRVVRNGVRNLGQQVLEVVIVTPTMVDDAAAEAQFATLLQKLIVAKSGRVRG